MTLQERIEAFSELGNFLSQFTSENNSAEREISEFENLIRSSAQFNGWFTPENVRTALNGIAFMLEKNKLHKWIETYKIPEKRAPKKIGVVMAGNIPLVGFHDFLCVLASGNICVAKLSSQDNRLLKALAAQLNRIEPRLKSQIIFEEGKLENINAVIATGSNNTSRYFEYYFEKYPHIIRKNRNSVAVISGSETPEQLALLGEDIFRFFGLGCRNVSKLYVPQDYDFNIFFKAIENWRNIIFHSKYANNYDYNKAILLVNKIPHFDNGFLLLKIDDSLATPVARLNFSYYSNIKDVKKELEERKNEIQCIVADSVAGISISVSFGKSQSPELWDYADGVDTMEFLISL